MLPKKKPTAAAKVTTSEAGDTKFSWTAENDRLLLILTMGRTLTTEDYSKLVEAIPGSNYNGVRIRVSKMRIEQRSRYEALGWGAVEDGKTSKTAKTTGEKKGGTAKTASRKRKGGSDTNDGGDEDEESSETKGRGKKARVEWQEGDEEEGEIKIEV
ncbi:hypothetical protein N0V95_001120 [Ascochyta clinopodiicola]|nr:hypothetical protein N0V95_001120 [Ascochyta clinopodiicola]